MAGFAGCESTSEPTADANATTDAGVSGVIQKPLIFPAPVTAPGGGGTGKWTAVPRDGGAEYVQVLGDMEDIVSFYGFWSEVAPEVRTFEDMERVMRADQTFGFQSLERGEILGVPVLWFEKSAAERGEGSRALATLLKAKPRRPGDTYLVKTRGVFLLQPGREPRFVTIACARTNVYGQIGEFYAGQFRDWLTVIVQKCFL